MFVKTGLTLTCYIIVGMLFTSGLCLQSDDVFADSAKRSDVVLWSSDKIEGDLFCLSLIFFGTQFVVLSQNIKTKSLRVCLFETTLRWLVYFGVIGNLKPYEFKWDACVKQFHSVSIRGHVVSEAWLSSDHLCFPAGGASSAGMSCWTWFSEFLVWDVLWGSVGLSLGFLLMPVGMYFRIVFRMSVWCLLCDFVCGNDIGYVVWVFVWKYCCGSHFGNIDFENVAVAYMLVT